MFHTSFSLLLRSVITNIIVPLIPWMLTMWILTGTRWKWWLLYLFSWFMGVWVIANRMFDIQFIWFGIWLWEYLWLLIALIGWFLLKLYITKQSLGEYLLTLKIEIPVSEMRKSFSNLTRIEKILTWIAGVFAIVFMINSFVFTSHMPTYADDSFGNRNRPIVHILHDWWIKLFGSEDEILARSRLWYPLHIPIYKTIISQFNGWYNDVYNNLFQYFTLLFWLIFIGIVTWRQTGNIFASILPIGLICTLPLVFIHSVEWYMELPSAMYSILVVRLLYDFLIKKDSDSIILAFIFACILCYVKLDWLVVYLPGIIWSFLLILYLQWSFFDSIKNFCVRKYNLIAVWSIALLCFIPFQVVRLYHGLWLNPSDASGTEKIGQTIHREIFSQFKNLFIDEDNYGVWLIIFWLMLYQAICLYRDKKFAECYFVVCTIMIFIIITLVFLLTSNYQWVMNQTTVNRVYTMIFVILFSFIWISYHESK